ncbi:hypothetical protein QFC21_003448 [Naganishia friedmannii]|uniref:Uncharacterized protein n=1 Tax=Naganishia friedmannii TaxID=89922 RepID=A0ACC2VP83_9TREE|nr:hypothetical protein QFC21_003448 [Naganishia friedmannii]
MKTGTAPAASQDFRIAEDILEEVFQGYLSAPRGDRGIYGEHDPAREHDWAERQEHPTVERALYASPYIPTIDRLCAFATAVLKGDSRWDSLKRIPYSTPGRYVQVLDLSYLDSATTTIRGSQESRAGLSVVGSSAAMTGLNNPAGDGLRLNGCLNTLLPLLPHLEILILPSSIPVAPSTLRALQYAPCRLKLRVLHGLVLTHTVEPTPRFASPFSALDSRPDGAAPKDIDSMVALLRAFPNLTNLSIKGYGDTDPGLSIASHPQPILELPHLRTLAIHGVKAGLLMARLCSQDSNRSPGLPSLRNLDITTYADQQRDLTVEFIRVHGDKLRNLTLRGPIDWPPLRVPPPSDVLYLCPKLETLRYLDPNTLPPIGTFENSALPFTASHHQTLRHLHISKWSTAPTFRDEPHPPSTGQFERLFEALMRNLPPHLEDVQVENFTWLRKPLGKAALSAGVNGVCRRLSGMLALRGVRLLDKDGTERPDVGGAGGGVGTAFGMNSMIRGLSGLDSGGVRLGMKGFGDRRRPSMDGDVDDESG